VVIAHRAIERNDAVIVDILKTRNSAVPFRVGVSGIDRPRLVNNLSPHKRIVGEGRQANRDVRFPFWRG
jgi:hypothetical protein